MEVDDASSSAHTWMASVNKTQISMSRGRLFIRPYFERQIPVLRRAEDMAWCTMERSTFWRPRYWNIRIDIPNCAVLRWHVAVGWETLDSVTGHRSGGALAGRNDL